MSLLIAGGESLLQQAYMDPARVQGFEVQTRFGTRLQSYIRPACRASDEALGLDGLPRASFC